ncbi:cyclase [Calidifontibacter sp. DB0510]|uniref:Cyclase n=1 Tax=Metallococcus carri TaxID=1656884 RepID=A0A967B281_9MICO|nr:SRPBCC family protein [Metallococcus carri]NHN55945.1 cyclase [Metallococcus carri]NOP37598.1 cyclase [Calidifontibacter sp. DB2511S]
MPDSTQSTVTINAAPATVLTIIADFPTYPQWSDHVRRATVLREDGLGWPREVEFVLDAGVVRDTYTLGYDWEVAQDGTGEVRWHLVRSNLLKGIDGSYQLRGDRTTTVTYQLTVDIAMPVIAMLRRKAERTIIDTALEGLKKRAEA